MSLIASNQPTTVNLLTTGGTIEKTFDEGDGSLLNRQSVIKDMIQTRLRLPHTQLRVRSLMSKDSTEMDVHDRRTIGEAIRDACKDGCPIVVSHGTDTMEKTARYCFENYPSPSSAVIFTGAMRPVDLRESDSMQNIAEALVSAKLLPAGYYVVFHNQVFTVPNVRKNIQRGTFEAITSEPS